MKSNYIPSDFVEKKNNTTRLANDNWMFSAEGYFFDREGNFLVDDFKKAMFDQKVTKEGFEAWAQTALDNLNKLLSENVDLTPYYDNATYSIKIPAKVKCCNQWLELYNFTNTCDACHSDYNTAGQLLVSREFWGEETGENYSDVSRMK